MADNPYEQGAEIDNQFGWETEDEESEDGDVTRLIRCQYCGQMNTQGYTCPECEAGAPWKLGTCRCENNGDYCDACDEWVESRRQIRDGKTLGPADKLRILTDPTLGPREAMEKAGEWNKKPGFDRRGDNNRRKEERCECGHGPFWHAKDGKCLGTLLSVIFMAQTYTCSCVEYLPKPDRRAKWLGSYEKVGKENGYPELDIQIYKAHIEHIAATVKLLWPEKPKAAK